MCPEGTLYIQEISPSVSTRIDEIVFFDPLDRESIGRIAWLQLESVIERLATQGKELVLTDGAVDQIAEEGYSFEYGARNLSRVLRQRLLDPLALAALSPDWGTARRVVLESGPDGPVLRLDGRAEHPSVVRLEESEPPFDIDDPTAEG